MTFLNPHTSINKLDGANFHLDVSKGFAVQIINHTGRRGRRGRGEGRGGRVKERERRKRKNERGELAKRRGYRYRYR